MKTVIHEVQKTTGKHRIIIFSDGVADAGDWFEFHQVAKHRSLLANISTSQNLPTGIFSANVKTHQTLDV